MLINHGSSQQDMKYQREGKKNLIGGTKLAVQTQMLYYGRRLVA